jgi:hypothetical protein
MRLGASLIVTENHQWGFLGLNRIDSGINDALRRCLSAILAITFCICTKRTGVFGCVRPTRISSVFSHAEC